MKKEQLNFCCLVMMVSMTAISCGGSEKQSPPALPDTLIQITEPMELDSAAVRLPADAASGVVVDSITRTDSAFLMKKRLTSDTIRKIPAREKGDMENVRRYMQRKRGG